MTRGDDVTTERHPDRDREVGITVNEQDVLVPGPRVTGLQIKQAAIEQGLPIGLDFLLSQLRPNGETKVIGDGVTVTVNKNSRFVAVAGDDNS
jgi:hypothetical protein